MSFSNVSLIDTLSSLILVSNSFTLSSNCLHSNLVAFAVARNLSGPHAYREALLFAGTDEAVIFLVAALFNNLCALEHGLHCSFCHVACVV